MATWSQCELFEVYARSDLESVLPKGLRSRNAEAVSDDRIRAHQLGIDHELACPLTELAAGEGVARISVRQGRSSGVLFAKGALLSADWGSKFNVD